MRRTDEPTGDYLFRCAYPRCATLVYYVDAVEGLCPRHAHHVMTVEHELRRLGMIA